MTNVPGEAWAAIGALALVAWWAFERLGGANHERR